MIQFEILPRRVWFLLLAIGAFGLIGGGLIVQDIYRLSPCPLCIFQRLLYLAIGGLALLGVLWPAFGRWWGGLILAIGLGGLGVAAYQSWMQAFPELASECSFVDPNAIERLVDWLGMQWPSLFLATGFCSTRDWELLGLSIANWSVICFAGCALLGGLLMRYRKPY